MTLKVIDDFLPESLYRDLREIIYDASFPWNYNEGTTIGENGIGVDSDIYFTHLAFKREVHNWDNPMIPSRFHLDAKPVLYFVEEKFNFHIETLLRIHCTLVVRQNFVETGAFHTDYSIPHYTGILYMNDCDGPTVFEEGLKVDFRRNRFALFDGTMQHAASQQSDANRRVNVVFNFQGHFK